MGDVEEYQKVYLNQTWNGVGERYGEEDLAVVVEDVVDVGDWFRDIVVLKQILVHIYPVLLLSIEVYENAEKKGCNKRNSSKKRCKPINP